MSSKAEALAMAEDMFKLADKDNSGFIETKELAKFFTQLNKEGGKPHDAATIKKEVQGFMSKMDKNNDSKISFEEFKNGIMGMPD